MPWLKHSILRIGYHIQLCTARVKSKEAGRNSCFFAKGENHAETFVPMQDFYVHMITYVRLLCNTEDCDLTLYEQIWRKTQALA